MVSLKRNRKRSLAAPPPVIDPADRLSKLPDDVIPQILSFLPAQEAVQTCVLARTWRDAWKFTKRLTITAGRGGTVLQVRKFVDRLLRHRINGLECAPLVQCDIMFHVYHEDHEASYSAVNRWIRRALKCQVQALRLEFAAYFVINHGLLISRHLTRLVLSGIWFERIELNLDGCPALELLEIRSCMLLGVRKIMSPSLRRLVMTRCKSNADYHRIKINVPHLVSLWLEIWEFRAPILLCIPELVEAYVKIASFPGGDSCYCDNPMGCYYVMQAGYTSDSHGSCYPGPTTEGCVLLEGLAQAKDLVLLAHHSMYIFRRDLRWCPTFSNLKTLVLNNYWCQPADCPALACILQHAPILEVLTVLFSDEVDLEYDFVLEGRPNAAGKSTMISQHLKLVEVKYDTVHEGVHDVLKFLSTLNICFNSE